MNYFKASLVLVLMLTLAVTLSQQEHFVKGQPATDTQQTLCDSNSSGSLISGAAEQAQGYDLFVECAANNLVIISFPQVNLKWGFSAVDYILSRSNYTIVDIDMFGVDREASYRVIMSSK